MIETAKYHGRFKTLTIGELKRFSASASLRRWWRTKTQAGKRIQRTHCWPQICSVCMTVAQRYRSPLDPISVTSGPTQAGLH